MNDANEQPPRPSVWLRVGLHGPVAIGRWIFSNSKRIAVGVAGVGVIIVGTAMLVLPGPGVIVILAGLAILATEFVWAERALDAGKARAAKAGNSVKARIKRGS